MQTATYRRHLPHTRLPNHPRSRALLLPLPSLLKVAQSTKQGQRVGKGIKKQLQAFEKETQVSDTAWSEESICGARDESV